MRILLLSNVFPPGFIGGYELGAYEIAMSLVGSGNEVHVLTSDYFLDDQKQCEAIQVTRTLSWATMTHEMVHPGQLEDAYYNHRNIREIGRLIREFCPDVVLAFNLMGLGAVSIVKYLQALRMPLVLYLMDQIFWGVDCASELHQKYSRLFGSLRFADSTHIIAMSKNLVEEIGLALGVTLTNVIYITDNPVSQRNGQVRFVFCSRVGPHKGTEIMLEAVERLSKGFDNFCVDIYGAGQVAPFMHRVRAKGLDAFFAYKGQCGKKDMLRTLANYDALVFPTWEREAFGFVASEAGVAGCIPIMTAGVGASEWFLEGVDSLKISRDASSLCGAMAKVLAWPKEELLRKKASTARFARKNFAYTRWFPIVEQVCLDAGRDGPMFNRHEQSKAAESAFLYLSTLLRGALQ
jgi:glycosyltransferase involved in cell wall biosynthesis